MLRIRTMTIHDVPLGMRLKGLAHWNQTEADWRRFLALAGDGAFVAELDGSAVATTVAFRFDSIGWIAMVLVDPQVRRQGIATRLMEHALEYLEQQGVKTARLDATPAGRRVYQKLGFVAEYELARLEGAAAGGELREGVRPMRPADLPQVLAIDREVTGTNRRRLLEALIAEQPAAIRVFAAAGGVSGYLMFREGSRATQIGPAAALEPDAGLALVDDALGRCASGPVFIDIPTANSPAIQWAESRGLVPQRHFTRMRRGAAVEDRPLQLWASSGPEKG